MEKKKQKKKIWIILGVLVIGVFLFFVLRGDINMQKLINQNQKGIVSASGFSGNLIGYEFLDDIGTNVNEEDATVVHLWNNKDDYYFNKTSGIQFANNFNQYWTHNVFCGGYKNMTTNEWTYACEDELPFTWSILSDNSTYVNITGYRDITISGRTVRAGIRYHLEPNDENITIQLSVKNIGALDIPVDLGFAWRVKDIKISNNQENDIILINNTEYNLHQNINVTFYNLTSPYYRMRDTKTNQFLRLDWNASLNYGVLMNTTGEYNNPITLGINAGNLSIGQEKTTTMYWIDANFLTKVYFLQKANGQGGQRIFNLTVGVAGNQSVTNRNVSGTAGTQGGFNWTQNFSYSGVTNISSGVITVVLYCRGVTYNSNPLINITKIEIYNCSTSKTCASGSRIGLNDSIINAVSGLAGNCNSTLVKHNVTATFSLANDIVLQSGQYLGVGVYYQVRNSTLNITYGGGNFNSTITLKEINYVNPNIIITTPLNNTNWTGLVNINYSASDDTGLNNCWYSNDSYGINTSLTNCQTNITGITWVDGLHNVRVYANDTYGNINSSQVTFNVSAYYPNITFVSPTPANATTTTNTSVLINISIDDNSLSQVFFNWNGTNNTLYDNPILYMNFDNRSVLGENHTYVKDLSGNGFDAVVKNGAVWSLGNGKYTGGYRFDGLNDWMNITHNKKLNTLSYGTWNVWVNSTDKSACQGIITKRIAFDTNHAWSLGISYDVGAGDGLGFEYSNTGTSSAKSLNYFSNATFIENRWNMITVVFNASDLVQNVRMYVNGLEVAPLAKGSFNSTMFQSTANVEIGSLNQGGACFLNGTVDEIMILNSTLKASDVQELYFSNLYKYDTAKWALYINQSKNSSATLDNSNYTYFASIKSVLNKINMTDMRYINIGGTVSDTCTYSSGNYAVTCSDNCVYNSNVIGTNQIFNVTFNGFGKITLNANVSNFSFYRISGGCNVSCKTGGCIRV